VKKFGYKAMLNQFIFSMIYFIKNTIRNLINNLNIYLMKTLKITILFGLLSLFSFSQTVHTVDNRDQSGGQFTDLQAAVDAASPGDIIQVLPSPDSYGNIDVTETLTIMGLGHNPANTNGEVAKIQNISLKGNSAGSEIKGLRISRIDAGSASNSVNLDDMHIINNRITSYVSGSTTDNLSDGWIVEGNYFSSTSTNIVPETGTDDWQMKNNYMRGFFTKAGNTSIITNNIMLTSSNSHIFFYNCDNPLVNNNIFVSTGNLTEIGVNNSTIVFDYNITYSTALTIDPLPGSNNLDNTNPMFADVAFTFNEIPDFYTSDFDLAAGSPGINAGSDGTDIGIFGNNFLFDPNGRPNLTPYPESITITNSVVAPGQTLNVNFTATQKQ
jgi:hypothetical protein